MSKLFPIEPQPTDTTCGPTCLHAVYRYLGTNEPLEAIVERVTVVEGGGTLAVHLGIDALLQGFRATLYTYNLSIFDPTWFEAPTDLPSKLLARRDHLSGSKAKSAIDAYLQFLQLGGKLSFEDLSPFLISKLIHDSGPLISGLSSTYLYRTPRETDAGDYDDVRGEPGGHFVVLYGCDPHGGEVDVADPYGNLSGEMCETNHILRSHHYHAPFHRLLGSIFLGVLSYDANVLSISK